MCVVIHDSYIDNKTVFIKTMTKLVGEETLICVYRNGKLKTIRRTFEEIYDELECKGERIVVTKHGDDVMMNNFLIKRTTSLGKSILTAWWCGHSYEYSVFDAFKLDSPLLKSFYES